MNLLGQDGEGMMDGGEKKEKNRGERELGG